MLLLFNDVLEVVTVHALLLCLQLLALGVASPSEEGLLCLILLLAMHHLYQFLSRPVLHGSLSTLVNLVQSPAKLVDFLLLSIRLQL